MLTPTKEMEDETNNYSEFGLSSKSKQQTITSSSRGQNTIHQSSLNFATPTRCKGAIQ
jgi:hypothetical protein